MKDAQYFVYYDTANGRPRRNFGHDVQSAIDWASDNADKKTEVIECRSVWSFVDAQPTTKAHEHGGERQP